MKYTLKTIIGVLAISFIALASCKKKKDESSKAKLQGKWKVMQTGMDDNNNGVMDASELVSATDSISSSVTFNGDGNGAVAAEFLGTTFSIDFTWSLINNDADINIKPKSGSGVTGISETTFHIESISFSDMVTSDTTTVSGVLTRNWSVYKKQ